MKNITDKGLERIAIGLTILISVSFLLFLLYRALTCGETLDGCRPAPMRVQIVN